jgi:hypothetical protein
MPMNKNPFDNVLWSFESVPVWIFENDAPDREETNLKE